MAKKRKVKPLLPDAAGEELGAMLDAKRRLIACGIESGDPDAVWQILFELRGFLRYMREDLGNELREGTLKDMTPEQAQKAIYGIQIFEDSLQTDFSDLMH